MTKPILLAIGDKYETEIAKRKAADAPYSLRSRRMTFSAILFYILAVIVLYGAVRTVTAKNPVHAALHLVLTFCVSAMIWMLMQAEFLGVTLVVVYVGAVMVLFLFRRDDVEYRH